MFDDAMKRAKELDVHFQKTGKVTGPLHGLPVSLKDNFNIPGYPSSVGFCSWALEPMKEESTIVGILRDLGAVAYVKTNVPTAMMIAESVNNCYGRFVALVYCYKVAIANDTRTTNPSNRATTSGGSSGGESALIALRGSPLGVGTDIGGSLRIPASCTGIYAIRPSYGRYPHFDARSGLKGQEAIGSVHGPMARSVADMRLFTANVSNSAPWLKDPKCIEMPWRSVTTPEKPTIAVLWDNGIIHPTPPVTRALKETVQKLKAKGYKILDWPSADHREAMELMGKLFVADGGKSVQDILAPVDEPFRPEMKAYEQATELGVYDLWQLQAQRTALTKRYLDRWNSIEGLDAILGPVSPYAGSPRAGGFKDVGYTGVFNITDYSSVSFPTEVHVDKAKDVAEADFRSYGEADTNTAKEYEPELCHGLPVSLQLTGRRLQEEKILTLTEKIVNDLKS